MENDYKIYAYRVDAIHSITYSILNTMARRQQDIDGQGAQGGQKEMEQVIKMDESSEAEYLERRVENLNFTELELVTRMDPILERTKREFDLLGNQSIMMDNLPLDLTCGLQLVRKQEGPSKYPPWGNYSGEWQVEDPLMVFIELAGYRSELR